MEFKDKVIRFLNQKKDHPILTKFLTLSEQQIIQNTLSNKVYFRLYGGYKNAELKRAVLYHDTDCKITAFQIYHNEKYLTLTHQNMLGTLLSLSISKESIGDILPKQGVFFVTSEIKEFIALEFTKINQVSITLEEIDGQKVHHEKELKLSSFTADSLRLDLVVSKLIKQSRNDAQELLQKELIKVNHIIETKPTKQLKTGDIISIRKHGRFELLDTSNTSRKGKIIVKYGKFI